ncbi:MAG: metallophosphoesterase [Reyranella sp.]|uniref:metallophosphoesterase n=1 Tax=Reyranella sp. TaxID=1929291 RepID=UPI0025E3FC7D|nr:metallophosphoesterase [Reyranella sp.]MBR2816683.1 metallophosphoesterase [Reyranella sp.]
MNTLHPIRPTVQPKTGKAPLFSFAVVADTHVNERDGSSSSPCETNALANDRARHVFHDIAAMDPAPKFVFHLGDIVHPVPSVPTFGDAVARFKEISSPLRVPLHVLPGNHDVGDKKIDWMPADQICDSYLETYRKAFGRDYYSFDEGNLRFVAINSLLLNAGLEDERRQREWLEEQIGSAEGKRVFLFMHYPPYVHTPDERGSYDNIDEPARGWLLQQIRRPNVEAVFAGHVHNFWYDRVGSADFYMLPSTAFLRHDLTEFYRVAPAVEFGRGDAEKFGYFVVDVYPDGHVAYSVRTHGQQIKAGEAPPRPQPVHLAHPRMSTFDKVGVELRHPWAESQQITATGGVQEFGRKWARNDYPLLALWEMGARLSKIPDIDLADAAPRARMELMARLGQQFIVTSLGRLRTSLSREEAVRAGVAALEVNATLETFDRQREALRAWRATTGVQVFLSKIHTFDDSHFDGKHFNHFVKAGFTLADLNGARDVLREALKSGAIDGVTVRVEADEDLIVAGSRLATFAEETGSLVLASLKTSGANLATERADDREMVARTAQAMVLSKASERVRYVFDTFMDVDRGYFPRHAFIDRRFDPRPAARAFAIINTLLSSAGRLALKPVSDGVAFSANGRPFELLDGEAAEMHDRVRAAPTQVVVHDLVTGMRHHRDEGLAALARQSTLRQVLLLQMP